MKSITLVGFIFGLLTGKSDQRWNLNNYDKEVDRVEILRQKYFTDQHRKLNFEEIIVLENTIKREYNTQIASISLFGVILVLEIVHLYLCFIINYLFYRKTFNIYIHLGFSFFLIIGTISYFVSFLENNQNYNKHFEILYERIPSEEIPFNPCKFPQLHFAFFQTILLQPSACQDAWTKFLVLILQFANCILHICTACVIGCFVKQEDAAELLYKELELQDGGLLPPITSLPPLPYYSRPIKESPTSKHRFLSSMITKDKRIKRIEVSENWTDPRIDLTATNTVQKSDPNGKVDKVDTVNESRKRELTLTEKAADLAKNEDQSRLKDTEKKTNVKNQKNSRDADVPTDMIKRQRKSLPITPSRQERINSANQKVANLYSQTKGQTNESEASKNKQRNFSGSGKSGRN